MSKQSWEAEFYPISAGNATATVKEAIEHSLKKWEGLSRENLEKHDLKSDEDYHLTIVDRDGIDQFGVYAETCALCLYAKEYISENGSEEFEGEDYGESCGPCPLHKVDNCSRGGSSYNLFRRTGNPEPMIEKLKQCLVGITTV